MEECNYILKDDYDETYKDNRGNVWGYYSSKAAEKNNLLNSLEVIGYIVKRNHTGNLELKDKEKSLYFHEDEKLNPLLFKTIGYMVCGDGQMIRVIEKSNHFPVFAIVVLLIIALAAGAYWLSNRDSGPVFEDSAIAYKMPEGTPANNDETKIMIPGYGDLPIKADTDELYAALINPEGNQCYFKYKIVLKEGNQTVYESDLIKPGTAVTNVKLNQPIKKGSYDIKIVVLAYSLDDYEQQLNGGVVETKLIAK